MGRYPGHKKNCKCVACRKAKKSLHLRIDEHLDSLIQKEAKEQGVTITEVVTSALVQYLVEKE